ncbi:hypothetical protein ABZ341_35835 [Streptomyces sp. NPDC006173]|uniref:hypothetical protein n=1 Tax=Streptomyces sp. NPDC006173 TaxID=3155349 RepID=UPI00340C2DD5
MRIIVMRELRKKLSEGIGTDGPSACIKAVHAASIEESALSLPGDRTFCGEPTADMERTRYQPAGPASPWLPPSMADWECPRCADELAMGRSV